MLSDLIKIASFKLPKKIVVATAEDTNVLEAIKIAHSLGLVIPVLTGNKKNIQQLANSIQFDISLFEILEANDEEVAAHLSVQFIKDNHADILMKGFTTTRTFLKAIIDPIHGIKIQPIMSHIALLEIPSYFKILAITDVAMHISPSLDEKKVIIENAIEVLKILGIETPKVAILCPVDKLNLKIESTVHAVELVKMNRNGAISSCIIDGPFALDNAISFDSANHKGIHNAVAGNADLLLCPNLDTGNALYKSLIFLAKAQSAAVVFGASAPIVLTSRSDSVLTKLYSIALASILKK